MLEINRQGNSVVVEGNEHSLYPYNGVLTLPLNSIICVVDESDIATFRSAANYDIVFSAKVSEIKINGETVTNENIGDKFGDAANASRGGGGGEGGTTNYNDLTNKPTLNGKTLQGSVTIDIPSKTSDLTNDSGYITEHQSLEGYATEQWVDDKGYLTEHQDISGKLDKAEAADTYQPKGEYLTEEADPVWNAEKANYTPTDSFATINGQKITEGGDIIVGGGESGTSNYNELTNKPKLNGQTLQGDVTIDIPSKTSDLTNDSGYLTEHQDISGKQDVIADLDTIRDGASKGATALQSYTETDPLYTADKPNIALKSEIPSLDGYATEQWVEGKGYITDHQSLKTINGESIVGDGDIEIQGGITEETCLLYTSPSPRDS